MEGGYPIIVDGECIGGIGVSGGNWEFDDRVARDRGRRDRRQLSRSTNVSTHGIRTG